MENNNRQGYTMWARKTIDSEIFYDKPHAWFKIWFFLVNRVNFQDVRKWKRGQCFTTYQEIIDRTKATPSQVQECIKWLKKEEMFTTQKATRGFHITVVNYDLYQTHDSYKLQQKLDKNYTGTTLKDKNDKKDKNTREVKTSQYEEVEINQADGLPLEKPEKKYVPKDLTYRKIFDLFPNKPLNWQKNRTQISSAKNILKEHGLEKAEIAITYYEDNKDDPFIPQIIKPSDLDRKWQDLQAHNERN